MTSDFAIGLRRVRTGYVEAEDAQEAIRTFGEGGVAADGESLPVPFSSLALSDERVRLVGQEIRGAWGYNVLFDPAGSRVLGALIAEAGDYALVRSGGDGTADGDGTPERIRSGIGWGRLGIEFNRPSYVLAPYISVPIVTWANVRGEPVRYGPRPDKARFGLRVMFR